MTSAATNAAATIASVVFDRHREHTRVRDDIVRDAADAFTKRDWRGLQDAVTLRLDAYAEAVHEAVRLLRAALGDAATDRDVWAVAKDHYVSLTAGESDLEIAETFFNSITRRLLTTVGVDPDVEFLAGTETPAGTPRVRRFSAGEIEEILEAVVTAPELAPQWHNLGRDVRLAAEDVRRALRLHGAAGPVDEVEVLESPFYRGQGAYLVGRLRSGSLWLPLGVAIHHTTRGLTIGAVLTETGDVGVLFSYTRAAFFVATDCPGALVRYLGHILPKRSRDELYTAIGFRKHAKTELFRDFYRHITTSSERFDHARGIRGMVMIVFTVPGYDVVFKVIRDRFPYPKDTTRRRVMEKYRLVTRHDRAGRLVDAHEFENLRFDIDRFEPSLVDELREHATRSVAVDDGHVTLQHVYVERRLAPLDLYIREANPIKARSAIIDYGRAIKNLAAANVFPGDMLLKNFGVTRGGRVVFYDYDEITPLTECNFRELPVSDRPDEEMSADPWFGVGQHDVFPEEFRGFLGLRGELREALDYHHGDIFGVRFWKRMQDRLRSGEVIEIFPYKRSRRLGAGIRRIGGPAE